MKIALIADTHAADRAVAFNANLQATLADIAREECELIIHLGDITADAVRDPADFAQARRLFDHAPAPVLFLPGNHDIGDNPPSGHAGDDMTDTPFDPERLDQYRQHFGADFWVKQVEGWRLIGLNAQLFGVGHAAEDDQFARLEQALTGWEGPIAVFLHKPLLLETAEHTPVHPRYVPPPQRTRLLTLLSGHDVRLVVSGHVHQHRRLLVDGIAHIWTPSVAFTIPDEMQERIGVKEIGYALVNLSNGHYDARFVVPSGGVNFQLSDFPEVYPELLTRSAQ